MTKAPTKKSSWKEVLQSPNLIGGDLQFNYNGMDYRGRIKAVHDQATSIVFEFAWAARRTTTIGWRRRVIHQIRVSKRCTVLLPEKSIGSRVLYDEYAVYPRGKGELKDDEVGEPITHYQREMESRARRKKKLA